MHHAEVIVVAGKREVTSFPVDSASPAERLCNLTVLGDRTTPVSTKLARARTIELDTAADLAKSTLNDSVRRADVNLSYQDVSRLFQQV